MMDQKRVYAVATAHLDTSWLWDLETTINAFIPATLKNNFALFEKHPDYVFNFEGSYRYELIEEYYPEWFERLRYYVAKGNWVPCGSCYENGDVNTPSPEALFRNILYGNDYFREKFGKPSDDIFLPDCFGFGWALPSIAAHANLHGFTTQKLTWSSAYGIPFDLGKWRGVDGSFIYASLNPGSYTTALPAVRENRRVQEKLRTGQTEYDLPFVQVFHGVGDRGGSPGRKSVQTIVREAARNANEEVQVLSAGAYDVFTAMRNELTAQQQEQLPEWNDELLLTAHGVGSYTSRAVGKRWNRRCEQLADAAERSSVAAKLLADKPYPKQALEQSWKRVIAHQFHDDITGTSFQRCYQRNWNDYVQSMNQFAEEYRAGSEGVATLLDTSFVKGTALVVSNPLQAQEGRCETVCARIPWTGEKRFVRVLDAKGKEVPSQINVLCEGEADLAFTVCVPGVGYAAYDVQEAEKPCAEKALLITEDTLENDYLRVQLDKNGCVCSLWDKTAQKETLRAPLRLTVIDDRLSKAWPAWEMQFQDVMRPTKTTPELRKVTILEQGAARVALEVVSELIRNGRKSSFRQILSLDADARALRVYNEVDWYCAASMLKVEFPLANANPMAAYDLGLGVIERGNNSEKLFEVPAQAWADISEPDGSGGVSLFSDSRCGWDKPDDNTLRLTAIHTPLSSYRWECAQHLMDMGLNRFSFALYPHSGDWRGGTQEQAARFLQPMQTFVTTAHKGVLGKSYSFAALSTQDVLLRAIKQAENSDEVVVRFQECAGQTQQDVRFSIANGIASARELYADETPLGEAALQKGELLFSIGAFAPKTFALTLTAPKKKAKQAAQTALALPMNCTAITTNEERGKATTPAQLSFPRELLPAAVLSGGVSFTLSQEFCNTLRCGGERLSLPAGAKSLHLLACACGMDTETQVAFNGVAVPFTVQCSTQAIGAWDLPGLQECGYIKRDTLAFTATHAHNASGDCIAKQLYLFKYSFAVPEGTQSVTLPNNRDVLLFAATASEQAVSFEPAAALYDELEPRPLTDVLTREEKKYANPSLIERLLNKVVDRNRTITIDTRWGVYVVQMGDIYYAIRKVISGSK